MIVSVDGFKYWWRRLLGWFPIQPCMACSNWYWGGLPFRGWQASYQEYCSKKCYEDSEW